MTPLADAAEPAPEAPAIPPADPNPYTMPSGAPIGAKMSFAIGGLTDPSVVQSSTWSGGSNVAGYFSAPGDQPAPAYMSVQGGVSTTSPNYVFYLPATAPGATQPYTIKVHITYKNNSQPSDLSADFDAVAPAMATFSSVLV